MKKNKVITADTMRLMKIKDFKALMETNQVVIKVHNKRLCRAMLNREEPDDIRVMNYSEFTRSSKLELKEVFKDKKAIIKLLTNSHHQMICYLVP